MIVISAKGINSQVAGLVHPCLDGEDSIEVAVGFIGDDSFAPCKKRATDALLTGLLFLPAAGNRNGTSVNNAGTNGNYWSSTANDENNAYNVNFNSDNLNADNNNRNNGQSVRLVRQDESTYPLF